ncbi:MAG: hypothetical protein ACQERR_04415 [Pseudomonadota bacterium]
MPGRRKRNQRRDWDLTPRQPNGGGGRWATSSILVLGLLIAVALLLLFVLGLGRETQPTNDELPEGHVRIPLELPDSEPTGHPEPVDPDRKGEAPREGPL